jgi:uncharacterized membrane protein
VAVKKKTTKRTTAKTSKGKLQMTNVAVCYLPLVGWVPAAVYMVLEKDRRVRWHAMQSLLLNGVSAVAILATSGSLLGFAVVAFALVLMLVLSVRVYNGEDLRLPVLGSWTEMIVHKG